MARVWILTGALLVVSFLMFIFQGFMGKEGMLTIGLCIGSGAAAAYIHGQPGIGRAMYLFGGVFIGALGFLLGAMTFPDTNTGLFLGAAVPQLITGFAAMWSKRTEMFIAATIGAGTLAGVYASDFDLDPQSINVSLPIAIGQTILPMGLGFLAAVLARTFAGDDPPRGEQAEATDEPSDDETATFESADDTQQMDLEGSR
jgi:hypothetical protein